MESPGVQQLFFRHIKSKLEPHLSFADEIAELLNISNDSAYRRIRGEKPISFEEIRILSSHYRISIDQFLHIRNDSFLFSGRLSDDAEDVFIQYLQDLLENLVYLNGFEQKHLYYLAKDIPWINYFQVSALSSFKIFLWRKSFLGVTSLKGAVFSAGEDNNPAYREIEKKIVYHYNRIPTTEIWNLESINATLQQIEYYRQCKLFKTNEDIVVLYDRLEELVSHIERQAELGKKFAIGEAPGPGAPDFNMFDNELALGDNTVLVDAGKIKIAFLNHSVIDFMATRDERFSNHIHKSIVNIMHKSTQISTVGEKDRNRFFNRLREKIHRQRELLRH